MSLNRISGSPTVLVRPLELTRTGTNETEKASVPQPRPEVLRPEATKPGLLGPRHDALPADAPAGTDPALWQVLTSQERAYFAKMTAMGPLTYGRAAAGPAATASGGESTLARGGRIDVKV
jgi:hypothetical protein